MMSIGLKRGTVRLEKHQRSWEEDAQKTIADLFEILEGTDVEIHHVGSTAIKSIKAKPIIDLLIGVDDYETLLDRNEILEEKGFILRQDERPNQLLYVKGDLDNDFITHHIHVLRKDSKEYSDYLNLRDYLNANKDKASVYEKMKQELAKRYPDDRNAYTEGKSDLINQLLIEAEKWRKKIK